VDIKRKKSYIKEYKYFEIQRLVGIGSEDIGKENKANIYSI
jgi:hypothetical protein